jgi:hypothetical protein
MLDVNISGSEELSKKLNALAEKQGNLDRVLAVFAQKIFESAFEGANKHSKDGMLVRSLGTGAKKTSDKEYVIEHDLQFAKHALYINYGTPPHEIRPKDKKALRWANGGGFFFSKFVKHPGYKGDPYFYESLQTVLRDFDSIVKANFKPLED